MGLCNVNSALPTSRSRSRGVGWQLQWKLRNPRHPMYRTRIRDASVTIASSHHPSSPSLRIAMPKRHRPPSPSPSRLGKRPHPDQSSLPTQLGLRPLFDLDELFLRVLSFLSPSDLARAQAVSRRWSVIAVDPQLWKALYLERYPHPHPQHTQHSNRLRANARASRAASWSVGGSGGSTPLRPIARLPSRAFPPPSPSPSPAPRAGDRDGEGGADRGDEEWRRWTEQSRHDGVDWKVIMRLGTNW